MEMSGKIVLSYSGEYLEPSLTFTMQIFWENK